MHLPSIPPLNPRAFTGPTPLDHSVYIGITSILLISFTALTLLVRLWVRYKKYSWDDAAVFLAQILAAAEFGVVIDGLVRGLGRAWSEVDVDVQDTVAKVRLTMLASTLVSC